MMIALKKLLVPNSAGPAACPGKPPVLASVRSLVSSRPVRGLALAVGLLCLMATHAKAAVADSWIRQGGAFRKVAPGQWQEFANGKRIFDFREILRTQDSVHLYDQSRGITVRLEKTQAAIFRSGNYLGSYQGRFIFTVFGYQGGEFRFINGDRWEEWQGGRKMYNFVETSETTTVTTLRDASRNITVELRTNEFRVFRGGSLLFTKAGQFVR